MAKTKISEFSSTAGNNTDIDSINIAEGCAPSGINNAIRELMAQLKDFQAGTAGDSFNGPVGTATAAAGAFTTLTTSSTVTHNGGTANGVAYLNGSKVLTTGSALTFDGTTLGVVGRLYNGEASTFGASSWAMSLGNGGVSANYFKADSTYWQNAAGTQTMQLSSGTLTTANDASVNGLTVGRGAGAVSTNTAVGASALAANTTGTSNAAFGLAALAFNTTGTTNSAFGLFALRSNTTGSNNTALGEEALWQNTTASNNTAVGYQALYANTTGSPNVAMGRWSLLSNTTGADNAAYGDSSLASNTTGSSNTGLGRLALYSNTTASRNTAVGYQAGYADTTGYANVFVGFSSGQTLTTGTGNTFVGDSSGGVATTGNFNTFVGQASGSLITTGAKNTIIGTYNGNQGGLDIRTSDNYIVLSDGDGNPRIYHNGTTPYITQMSAGAGDYTIKIANSGALSYDTSSARYKDNIRNSVYGLNAVMALQSRMFEYKTEPERTDIGLVAEEVFEVIPELVTVNADGQPDAVSYDRFVSVLVKAIQELKAEFDAYKATHP